MRAGRVSLPAFERGERDAFAHGTRGPERGRAEEAIHSFLLAYLADRANGGVRPEAEYLARFPGFEAEIGAELRALAVGAGAVAANGQVGPYRLLAELGRGAQGRVWLAEDTRLGRKVALKILSGMSGLSPVGRVRFEREAGIVSRLDHPGICTVYEAGEHEGVPYIAMRYLAGETLAKRMASTKAPPSSRAELARILGWIEEAARAVHVAHSAGIVHRDIKPGNIMLTADDHAVLLDFGTAHEVDGKTLTLSGDLFGTPAYMAPEQIAGSARLLDHQVDVHALGVTLFECLTLRLPFQGASRETLFREILARPTPDPRRLNPALPRDARAVLEKALEKEPQRRYATALELADELARLRRGEPVRARAITPPERGWRWARREPVRAGFLTAGLLAALLGGYVGLNWSRIQAASAEEGRARHQAWIEQAFVELERGEIARGQALLERARQQDPSNPEALAGLALCLSYGSWGEGVTEFLDAHAQALERYPALEWLRVLALTKLPGVPLPLDEFRRVEARKLPLGLFVSGLANEQGLSFEVTNLGRSMEFLARTLVTSRHARSLLWAGEDYGRRRADAELRASPVSEHLLFTFRPQAPGERIATSIKGLGAAGDVDRDGFGDFLVTFARGDPDEADMAFARVHSGRDATVLRTYALQPLVAADAPFDRARALKKEGPQIQFLLVPDVDGDGVPEHALGFQEGHENSERANRLVVFSGATGAELWRVVPGPAERVLDSLARIGDLDSDGLPDIGAAWRYLDCYSSRTGARLARYDVQPSCGSLASAGDVDGDGREDIVAGHPYRSHQGLWSGLTRIYSLWDPARRAPRSEPALLRVLTGKAMLDQMGLIVGSPGDIDGDGTADVFATEHWASERGFQTGRLRAFSGASGAELYQILGDVPLGKFGISASLVGDLDRDGIPDLGVGSPRSDRSGPYSGSISVFSGKTGERLLTIDGPGPNAGFGWAIADAGDVNADRTPDLLCAASYPGDWQELGGLEGVDLAGTFYVISGRAVR